MESVGQVPIWLPDSKWHRVSIECVLDQWGSLHGLPHESEDVLRTTEGMEKTLRALKMEDQKQGVQQAVAEVVWILLSVIKEISQAGEMAQREIKDLAEKLEQDKTKRLASYLASKREKDV